MNDKDPWDVPDWTLGYVKRLFSQRGYNATEDAVIELIEGQWHNWKRLLLETGLCHDRQTAEDTAFKFSTHKVIGGAGRIFENFAEYVQGKPKPVREFEESRFSSDSQGCELCEGQGVIMAEVVNREGRIKNAAFGCSCDRGRTIYGGIPQAAPEILDWRRSQVRTEKTLAMEYLKKVGCDPYQRIGFSEFNKMIQEVARIDRKQGKAQLQTGKPIDLPSKDQSPNTRNSRAGFQEPSEDELALAVFENGDERGWFE